MRSTFYQARYVNWPPVRLAAYANPDSGYWREQAETAAADFDRKASGILSDPDWQRFNQLFIDHYGEGVTWMQAFDCYHAAVHALAPGVTVEAVAYAAGILPELVEMEA